MKPHPALPKAILLALCLAAAARSEPAVSLAGPWRYALDRADAGIAEAWFNRDLAGRLKLPGSLPGQGIGDPITTNTPWVGGIVDKSFFTAPEYARYRGPGRVKVPFWLQPETYYKGAAWYQCEIEIPEAWQDRRVVLTLERPHWETRVWLDDRFVGANDSISTPHEYALGVVSGKAAALAAVRRALAPNTAPSDERGSAGVPPQMSTTGASSAAPEAGALPIPLAPGKHRLTLRVDNRMVVDIGENSHSISDHTQGNWNGIVGNIELRATALVWVEDLQVHPHLAGESVTLRGRIGNATGQAGQGTLAVRVDEAVERGSFAVPPRVKFPVSWQADGGSFECEVRVPSPKPWDEFHLNLYNAEARIEEHQDIMEARVALFGFREISTQGTQFLINGRKTFIRGTLECAIFPKIGHTPTDVESWRKVIRTAKTHGLNNLRFHSHCPPEAAFVAADELGMYLHVECGTWPNQSTTLGDGKPVDAWLYREADRILRAYGNHPSFVMLLAGNEPGGDKHVAYLKKWVAHYKAEDPRRLYSSGAGWPQIPENQFHVSPDPRIQAWGGGLNTRINAKPPETTTDYRDYIAARPVPVVSHEIGQWCVYPNFAEKRKYTGYLKPRNFEIFRDRLDEQGLGKLAKQFLLASGKLQTLCYKEDIESALRTPGMGGFQLLDLHDFPGQGTALVGVLDPFWEEKGYVTAREFSRFCNSTVPLARLAKRVFTTEEVLTAELEVANFGPRTLTRVWPRVRIVGDDGEVHLDARLAPRDIPVGNGIRLAPLNHDLRGLPAPARYKLVVSLGEKGSAAAPATWVGAPADPPSAVPEVSSEGAGHGTRGRVRSPVQFENDWDIWVYPAQPAVEPAPGIRVATQFDDTAEAYLASGGRLLLTLPGKAVRNFDTAPVKLGFSSIFWNTAWTGRQAPTTLGILCDPRHPALAGFPTDSHSNWQWWYLIHRAGALRLDLLPKGLEPIVRVIDDWFTARPLGLVAEGRVGRGRIVICGFDLTCDADDPVSRQMRASLLAYMASPKFAPRTALTPDQVRSLATPAGAMAKLGANVRASSEQEGHEAGNALDGDPKTIWHPAWGRFAPGFPHELILEFAAPVTATGLMATPRQDGNPNGWIKDFAVFVSADGRGWGEPVAKGAFERDAEPKQVHFTRPARARCVKLVAYSGHAHGPWASLAELAVLAADPAR
jgi:hypothetical protein